MGENNTLTGFKCCGINMTIFQYGGLAKCCSLCRVYYITSAGLTYGHWLLSIGIWETQKVLFSFKVAQHPSLSTPTNLIMMHLFHYCLTSVLLRQKKKKQTIVYQSTQFLRRLSGGLLANHRHKDKSSPGSVPSNRSEFATVH